MLKDITKKKCSFTVLMKQSSKMMYDFETKVQKKISKKFVGRMLKKTNVFLGYCRLRRSGYFGGFNSFRHGHSATAQNVQRSGEN